MRATLFLALLVLGSCSIAETRFRHGCIDVVKQRLRSPSTFELISASYTVTPIVVGEEIRELWQERSDELNDRYETNGALNSEETLENIDLTTKLIATEARSGRRDAPLRHLAVIEYDADNAFGTPIRGHARCEYEAWRGDLPSGPLELYVSVDGQTQQEWLIQQMEALQRRR